MVNNVTRQGQNELVQWEKRIFFSNSNSGSATQELTAQIDACSFGGKGSQ